MPDKIQSFENDMLVYTIEVGPVVSMRCKNRLSSPWYDPSQVSLGFLSISERTRMTSSGFPGDQLHYWNIHVHQTIRWWP
jgi:hypothetical protein